MKQSPRTQQRRHLKNDHHNNTCKDYVDKNKNDNYNSPSNYIINDTDNLAFNRITRHLLI